MVAHAGNVTAKFHGGKIALEGNKEDSMQTMQTRNKCTRDGISRREEGVEREREGILGTPALSIGGLLYFKLRPTLKSESSQCLVLYLAGLLPRSAKEANISPTAV